MNATIHYYRYFDATKQAEFLFDWLSDTIPRIITEEVSYIYKYDEFKRYLVNKYEMLDKLVTMMVRFLEQNNGTLSNRVLSKEFSALNENEVQEIERLYQDIFEIS